MNQKDLLDKITNNSSLTELQTYNERVCELRGFSNESIQETMLALLEEIGELAKSIRNTATNMVVDTNKTQKQDTAESEVADVFCILMTICSKLDINLYDAFIDKEKKNCERNWSSER